MKKYILRYFKSRLNMEKYCADVWEWKTGAVNQYKLEGSKEMRVKLEAAITVIPMFHTVFLFLGWFPTMQVTPKCWYPSASLTLPQDDNLHCYHHVTLKSH